VDNAGFIIPPKLYDFLKFVALTLLPASAALVITLGTVLGWDGAVITAGVITAVDTFLGVILGKSASNFKQDGGQYFGDLVIKQDVDGTPMGMKLEGHQENPIFEEGEKLFLKVRREQLLDKPPFPHKP
jgi:hypothetical protein